MKSIYRSDTNSLEEQSEKEKPKKRVSQFGHGSLQYYQCLKKWSEYEAHVATLRTIKCTDEAKAVFKNGEVYEEGKDYEVQSGSVNIYSEPGTKVMGEFKNGVILGGYDHDKDKAMRYIKEGVIYELERAYVGGWYTDFYLKEFPNIRFNSVHFIYPEPVAFPLSQPVQEDYWQDLFKMIFQFDFEQQEKRWIDSRINELKKHFTISKRPLIDNDKK